MTVISVQNVSKRYVLGHQRDTRDGLRHRLEDAVRNPFKWLLNPKRHTETNPEEFWALKDVSFDVKQGEVIGIIGRNGAGKSTLLKILSRITEPTSGRIEIAGRMASLLEVGTGFHPELTGRENIFLNGAILGMSKAEIKRKFDEIVAFSEIEKFLDTPVKRYSSGMYVRLAFAVAAHLEPEILVVDEVLAVGDAQFQKKCLGKMGKVANEGRTVLFVSHNMAAMRQLCSSALLLSRGTAVAFGNITEIVDKYLNVGIDWDGRWRRQTTIPNKRGIFFEAIDVLNPNDKRGSHFNCTEGFAVQIQVHATQCFTRGQIAVRFTNQEGVIVFTTCNADGHGTFVPIGSGSHCFAVQIPGNFLTAGIYSVQVTAHIPGVEVFESIENTFSISIEDVGSLRSIFRDYRLGAIEPILKWTERPISNQEVQPESLASGSQTVKAVDTDDRTQV